MASRCLRETVKGKSSPSEVLRPQSWQSSYQGSSSAQRTHARVRHDSLSELAQAVRTDTGIQDHLRDGYACEGALVQRPNRYISRAGVYLAVGPAEDAIVAAHFLERGETDAETLRRFFLRQPEVRPQLIEVNHTWRRHRFSRWRARLPQLICTGIRRSSFATSTLFRRPEVLRGSKNPLREGGSRQARSEGVHTLSVVERSNVPRGNLLRPTSTFPGHLLAQSVPRFGSRFFLRLGSRAPFLFF